MPQNAARRRINIFMRKFAGIEEDYYAHYAHMAAARRRGMRLKAMALSRRHVVAAWRLS